MSGSLSRLIPLGALFARTMRLQASSLPMGLARTGLAVIALMGLLMSQAGAAIGGAAGLWMLQTTAWIALGGASLIGLVWFSSAITEEKEEQTIGLLRMAGLSGVSILLAKGVARLWEVLLLLAMLLPAGLLAHTLGGVTLAQVLAVFAAISAFIVCLGGLALAASVVFRNGATASAAVLLVMIGLLLIPPILVGVAGLWNDPLWATVMSCNVFVRLGHIPYPGFDGVVLGWQVWSNVAVGGLGFLLAWACFARFAIDDESAGPERGVAGGGRGPLRRLVRLVAGAARAPTGVLALTWRTFHFICGGRLMWILRSVLVVGSVLGIAGTIAGFNGSHWEWRELGQILMPTGLIWLVVEVGLHLSRIYSEEVRWQTWAGLAALPHSIPRLAYAQALAVPLAVLPCIACILVGTALVVVGSAMDGRNDFLRFYEWLFGDVWGWCCIAWVVYFWHWCVFYSVVVRRGALALAIATMIGSWFVVGMVSIFGAVFGGRGEGVAVIMILVLTGISVWLHLLVPWRLRALAQR